MTPIKGKVTVRLLIIMLTVLHINSCYSIKRSYTKEQKAAFNAIFAAPLESRQNIQLVFEKTSSGADSIHALSWNLFGIYHSVNSQFDSATFAFSNAIKLLPKNGNTYLHILSNQAIAKKFNGDLQAALILFYETKKIMQEVKDQDTALLIKINGEIASILNLQYRYNEAIDIILNNIELLERNPKNEELVLAYQRQKLGNLYLRTKNHEFSERLYKHALPIFLKYEKKDAYYLSLLSMVEVAILEQNLNQAEDYAREALLGLKAFHNWEWISLVEQQLATVHFLKGDTAQGKEIFQSAFNTAIKGGGASLLGLTYRYLEMQSEQEQLLLYQSLWQTLEFHLSDVEKFPINDSYLFFEKMGKLWALDNRHKNAAFCLEKALIAKKEMDRLTALDALYEVQGKYQNILQNLENKQLKNEIKSQNRLSLYSLLIIVLLITVIITLIYQNQSKKALQKTKLYASEMEASLLQQQLTEKERAEAQKEELLQEQKKQLLQSVSEKRQIQNTIFSLLNKSEKSKAIDWKRELEIILSSQQFWKGITTSFKSLYPDFERRMNENYPLLTPNDIDFCILYDLRFSIKEISNILNIKHQSAITKKYRIAKKLQIKETEIFDSVIATIIR